LDIRFLPLIASYQSADWFSYWDFLLTQAAAKNLNNEVRHLRARGAAKN
jgi:hypothetical protein